jgi:hypothetical protein
VTTKGFLCYVEHAKPLLAGFLQARKKNLRNHLVAYIFATEQLLIEI